ncbi:hypothetical protein TL16_g12840, partial [Triparma laevis f. inornata]
PKPSLDDKTILNYASTSSGAVVLEASPNSKGMSNILLADKDKYAITPCLDKKWVVIGLSEDIQVKSFILAHYEKYSSTVKRVQLMGSQTFPTEVWRDLGVFEVEGRMGEERFEVGERALARYIKIRFVEHWGEEHYCTVSQVKVHGIGVNEFLSEEWEESNRQQEIRLEEVEKADKDEEEVILAEQINPEVETAEEPQTETPASEEIDSTHTEPEPSSEESVEDEIVEIPRSEIVEEDIVEQQDVEIIEGETVENPDSEIPPVPETELEDDSKKSEDDTKSVIDSPPPQIPDSEIVEDEIVEQQDEEIPSGETVENPDSEIPPVPETESEDDSKKSGVDTKPVVDSPPPHTIAQTVSDAVVGLKNIITGKDKDKEKKEEEIEIEEEVRSKRSERRQRGAKRRGCGARATAA